MYAVQEDSQYSNEKEGHSMRSLEQVRLSGWIRSLDTVCWLHLMELLENWLP